MATPTQRARPALSRSGRQGALRAPAGAVGRADRRARRRRPGPGVCISPRPRGARLCRPRHPLQGPHSPLAAVTADRTSWQRWLRDAPGDPASPLPPAAFLCLSRWRGRARRADSTPSPVAPPCAPPAARGRRSGPGRGGAGSAGGAARGRRGAVPRCGGGSTCATSAASPGNFVASFADILGRSVGPVLSLNRKPADEQAQEEAACRSPSRDRISLRQRCLLGHFSWLCPTQVSASFCAGTERKARSCLSDLRAGRCGVEE